MSCIHRRTKNPNRARFALTLVAGFKITPARVETLVASFPGTWVNGATKGGSVSSSTSLTVN